jgi:hypothetical protein
MSRLRSVVAALQSPALALAVFAFVALGAWALFANAGHALAVGARAGLVQGLLSAAVVFAHRPALKALSAHVSGKLALIAPPLITCALFLAMLIVALLLAGAPNIAGSIAAPALFALVLTAWEQWREQRRRRR